MVVFSHVQTLSGGQSDFAQGVQDLEIVVNGGQALVYGAARWGTGMAVWEVGGSLTPIDTIDYTGATRAFGEFDIIHTALGGSDMVLGFGGFDQVLQGYRTANDGDFTGNRQSISVNGQLSERMLGAAQEGNFLFVATADTGVNCYSINGDGSLRFRAMTGPDFYQGHVGAVEAVTLGGQVYVVASFTNDDRIASFRVNSNGTLQMESEVGAHAGLGIDRPNLLASGELDGTQYIIAGSFGSHTITVMEVQANGQLNVTDHAMDTLETRFGHISSLEVVESDAGLFVLAGGPDDGVSLLQVLPGGRLSHMASVADGLDSNLDNVTALAAVDYGDGLAVYAAGEAEDGLSYFEVDFSALGEVRQALGIGGNLDGTSWDDTLISGAGADTMTGGDGRDTFILAADGSVDVITDYAPGLDTLDLSDVSLLHEAGQLTVIARSGGATLYFGDFELEVNSADGRSLRAQDITVDGALSHLETGNVSVGDGKIVFGTNGIDALSGGSGDDLVKAFNGDDFIMAGTGRDTIDGGDGFDTLSFGDTPGRVLVDLENDVSQAGFARFFDYGHAAAAEYRNVEAFEGGAFADNLRGDSGANVLSGGGVSDRLYGRAGDDILNGGAGADALYGNRGADIMSGGDTDRRDRFIYFSAEESEAGDGNRDVITDFQPGMDRIEIGRIDADLTVGFRQDFVLIGQTQFDGTAGQLRFQSFHGQNYTLLQADRDGDGLSDFEIELTGIMTLTEDDFMF